MANSIPLAAIGVKLGYAAETTAGERPSAGYKALPDIKSTPSLNSTPNTADATTFDNEEYTTYVELLKDLGGALEFSANFTQALIDEWGSMMETYNALSGGKRMWYTISVPGVDKAVFFAGQPSEMGIPEMSANSLVETSVYITPISEPSWEIPATFS